MMPQDVNFVEVADSVSGLGNFILMAAAILTAIAILAYMQTRLSRREDKWSGLVLPGLAFTVSTVLLIYTVLVSVPETMQPTGIPLSIEESYDEHDPSLFEAIAENTFGVTGLVIALFTITNIPTVLMIAIYRSTKQTLKESGLPV
jgi:hypothetical protein